MTFVQLVKVLIITDNLEERKNGGITIFEGPGIATNCQVDFKGDLVLISNSNITYKWIS